MTKQEKGSNWLRPWSRRSLVVLGGAQLIFGTAFLFGHSRFHWGLAATFYLLGLLNMVRTPDPEPYKPITLFGPQ